MREEMREEQEMYERSYGYRYAELGDHPTNAQIAKAIRGDIKQAKDEGLLPDRWAYSVRSDSLAITVEVRDCGDAWQTCDGGAKCRNIWHSRDGEAHQVLTDEAEAAKMTLERIHGAYNHDGSEIQTDYFDVRYYGTVGFEDPDTAAWRKREAERMSAKKQARESGAVVGRVTNLKGDGTRVTHLLVEAADGRPVLGCGARTFRGSLLVKADDAAELTCSRCAVRAAKLVAAP